MESPRARWRVNSRPKFSVLEMGAYMVAEDDARETMLQNVKYQRLAPVPLYRHLYSAIPRFLASPTRDFGILDKCRADVEGDRDTAATPRARDNFTYELRALEAFQRSFNALSLQGWTLERAPPAAPLKVGGVSVSVQPTVHIRVRRGRYADLVGALLVDVAKGIEPKRETGKVKATKSMSYSAMLIHQYVVGIFPTEDPKPSTDHCIVFHSYRQEAVHCPTNYRLAFKDMEAACRNICRGWDGIEKPASFDPTDAVYR